MNYKQKLGYMLLGAGIMALGITIGQSVTPNIEARSDGVFDKITCREIEVVDEDGKKAIVLASWGRGEFDENHVRIYHPEDEVAIELFGNTIGTSMIRGFPHSSHGPSIGFELVHYAPGHNKLALWNKQLSGKGNHPAIQLECTEKQNTVFVRDRRFEWNQSLYKREYTDAGVAIGLHSHYFGNEIFVMNPRTGTMRGLEDR